MSVDMRDVKSSNISQIGYDRDAVELHVKFSSGQVYVYEGVPADAHQALVGADSVGSQFHVNIKNGGFKARKAE